MQAGNTLKAMAAALLAILPIAPAAADGDCSHRGDLDPAYCDANHDLVADPPKEARRLKNPAILQFSYTPVEDPSIYEKAFKPFTDYLARCSGRKVAYFPVQSNAAEIEAMRSGRLHIGAFATGPTIAAVNSAGAVPFALNGSATEFQGYHLLLIVRKASAFHKPADLKGRTVAHTSPSSNSGHVAPLALFPREGLTPDRDYRIVFSGKHDESVMGVLSGSYDAAAVASDVFRRMVSRGQIREDDLRVIYRSERFPTSSFAHAHDLDPALRERLLKCFFDYRFDDKLMQSFDGADRFYPLDYRKDWAIIRRITEASAEKPVRPGAETK